MKKDDLWVFLLVALSIIAFAVHWPFWIRLAVILNALVVIFNVVRKVYKNYKSGDNTDERKK